MNIPVWLFLFASSILTMTSIMGTFFITIPSIELKSEKHNLNTRQVILADSFIHSGPLILFLVLFNILATRTKGSYDLRKTFALLVIIALSYLGYIKFTTVYETYDYFCLIILSASVFISSYQIYLSLLRT